MQPRKSLGQHWLHDQATLDYIASCADISERDNILEVGPGTGTLTNSLLSQGAKVLAIEKDEELAAKLPRHQNLTVAAGDILKFDLASLPANYKVVANIPYYLTSKLLRVLCETTNPPSLMVLLVQKEVAARLAAEPGQMSLLAVSVQLYYEPKLGKVVPAQLFEPPPKVDSQVVTLQRRQGPLFDELDSQKFLRVVKAGFSERRKKLRSSLAGGLGITKDKADTLLKSAGLKPDARAQELSLAQWYRLYKNF